MSEWKSFFVPVSIPQKQEKRGLGIVLLVIW